MFRRPLGLSRVAGALLLASVALAAVSCAKKPVSLTDASLVPPVYPPGRAANTHLVMYPDVPLPVQLWQDKGEAGESADDQLLSTSFVWQSGPGAVVGMIIDSTNASQYQVFKRDGAGGYVELFPYTLKPTKTWPLTQFDAYVFTDPHPFAAPTRDYIGRGVVDGVINGNAPLTNLADLTLTTVPGRLQYLGPVSPAVTDSLVPLHWQAVPGAAGYWISMYGYPATYLGADGQFSNALPHPVMPERIPELLAAYIPAPNTSYRFMDPPPPGAHLVESDTVIVTNNDYAVRITAVDANGQVLDYTGSSGAYVLLGGPEGQYYRFPLNAVLVHPNPNLPPPTFATAASSTRLKHRLAPGESRISEIPGPRR